MKFVIATVAATIAIIPVAAKRNRRSKACKDIDVDIASLTLKVKGLSNQDTIRLFSVNNIIAFGDSLTDIGNANKDFPCTIDEVYCGDLNSNGPLIIDYIASDLKQLCRGLMLPLGMMTLDHQVMISESNALYMEHILADLHHHQTIYISYLLGRMI